ncbi:hypothetical protein [Spiroplasma sp. DGKH1]|uniref:hypothetical protein n=1 Tax=Spiroplasma sp. DGKH1 TaxID=3050074 RepID=UPI0034C5CD9D
MKKLLTFLTSLTIILPLPTTLVSCHLLSHWWDKKPSGAQYSACLLYKDHQPTKIVDDRAGRGKLWWQLTNPQDGFHIRQQQKISLSRLTTADQQFVNACESNMLYQASPDSINRFHQLTTTSFYGDIPTLANAIHPLNAPYSLDFQGLIDNATNLAGLKLTSQEKEEFANQILTFFNIITKVYGQNVINKLLYELMSGTTMSNPNVVAATGFALWQMGGIQGMMLGPQSASLKLAQQQYDIGYWSNQSIAGTLVHEMGHTISQYAGLAPPSRYYLNNFDPNIIDPQTVPHLEDIVYQNPSDGNPMLFYKFRPGDALVEYLGAKVGISDDYPVQQKLAAWSFIQSGYGRGGNQDGGNEELFAEGFSQWLLTPDYLKGLNWEALNEFYTSHLLDVYQMN